MNRANLLLAASLLLALPACNEFVPGGGGEAPTTRGFGSVDGTAGTLGFRFEPSQLGATFDATNGQDGDLDVYLCEAACPPLGGSLEPGRRMVTIYVRALQSEVRSGGSFSVGPEARVVAHHADFDGGRVEAISGEITIDSSDLREGGMTIGTFSVTLKTGERLSGFFEAPLLRVTELTMIDTGYGYLRPDDEVWGV